MAFEWAYNQNGGDEIIQEFVVKASEVISYGEMCSLDTGEVDAGATNDSAFVGAAKHAVDNTVDGHTVRVTVNRDAVYRVVDANARVAGATLDLASGGLLLTTSSNVDFVVVKASSATEPTYVMIAPHEHYTD